MKGAWGLIAVLCACAAVPAAAGTLYRCVGDDAVPRYVSERVRGASCTVAAKYGPEPSRREAAAGAGAPASAASGGDTGAAGGAPVATREGGRRVSGQVYSYIKDGVRHYTSTPPRGSAAAGATALRTIRYSL